MSNIKYAYLINQYPKVSHSFIRREIKALERQGLPIARVAMRGWDSEVVDDEDKSEMHQTEYILRGGIFSLLKVGIRELFDSPRAFVKGLSMAFRLGLHADRPLPFHLMYFLEACYLMDFARKNRIAHVHSHFGTNATEIAMIAKSMGGPSYSFTVHGPEEFDKNKLIHLKEKVHHASFVIAISAFTKSQLFRWVDFSDWAKIHEVHCGLEADFYNVSPVPVPDTPRLVCVGRLCEQKGQMLLVEAIALLAARNRNVELILAGDGEMRAEIEFLIRRHKLESQITITGWISSAQVRDYIQNSSAMVLPSFAEGLPVVIMEAMALKRPVLTTYVAGIPELVIDGETGWLFPAGDVEALADAIQRFMDSPATELSAMGERGYQRVIARHAVDTEAEKLMALFKAVPAQPL